MIARVTTFALDGVESRRVWVEADIRGGLPAFTIVGLADKAVREARERVRAAVVNSGFEFPARRITVMLAPASVQKAGPGFDLPLAIAVLVASGQLDAATVAHSAVAGELSLTGELRPVRGVLAIAEAARRHGVARLLVPQSRAAEAALVDGLEPAGVTSLAHAVGVLRGTAEPAAADSAARAARTRSRTAADDGATTPRSAAADGRSTATWTSIRSRSGPLSLRSWRARSAAVQRHAIPPRPHGHGLDAATSTQRLGKVTTRWPRTIVTRPSSSGCRSASSAGRANSESSSRKRTP